MLAASLREKISRYTMSYHIHKLALKLLSTSLIPIHYLLH
jgi:hypothetical protein